MTLITDANIADPDGFYERLLAAHKGLSPDQSQALNAELILILANHIGGGEVLDQALALARRAPG